MKKRILALLMAAIMILGMSACGESGKDIPEEGEKTPSEESNSGDTEESSSEGEKEAVTLRFYNYALSEVAKADWWTENIENFESTYDWIDIEPVTVDYNSMVTTFTNDIASGLTADLIYGEASWAPTLVDAGFIQSPKNVLSEDFYSGYYDYTLSPFEYNGEVYGVPHYYTNSIIFVNKNLIEAAGLSMEEFPDTLDGLKEWIETLAEYYEGNDTVSTVFGLTTAEVPATGSNINALYTAFGGTLVEEDGTLADLTTEQNQTAMEEMLDFYYYLISNGYTQDNLKLKDYRASFGAGNICMYVDSSWGYAQIVEVDANAGDFSVSAALPTKMGTYGEGKSLVESHSFLFGATLTDAQKEAADLFTQYCTSPDTMQGYLTEIGLAFPAHENMAEIELSPILEGAAKGVNNVVKQGQISAISSVQLELATMVLNYTVNGMSAEEAMNNYIEQADYYINQ